LSCGGFSYGSTEDYSISIQSLYACDLGAMSWDYPAMSSNDLTATEAVMITVVNVGTAAQSNFTVWYSLDNGVTQTTELVTTSVPSGVTYQHTFAANANFSTPGTFDCEFGVTLACDSNALNDSQALQVVNATSVSTFPYFQNFEAANFWQAGGAGSWAEGTPSANVINAAYSGTTSWATNLTGNHSANEYSWVESPFFNLSTLTAPVVEFKMWYEIHTAYADGLPSVYHRWWCYLAACWYWFGCFNRRSKRR
jgi:hypothetical protein